ncbi:MAG TPA: copper resistance protein CopC [Kineosporiaceae bacterium]|nr:copper resistance protein CopC [Kineosporiaceae bacterium]
MNGRDRPSARTSALRSGSRGPALPPQVAGGILVLVAVTWTALAGTALVSTVFAPVAQAAPPTVTLVQAAPPVGADLASVPASVTLTFDRNLTRGTLTVTGPRGDAAGAAGIYGATLTATLVSGLPLGTYTVSWTAKAKAGPPSRGSYSFRFTGLVSPPGPATPPESSPPTSGTTTATTPAAGAGAGSGAGASARTGSGAGPSTGSAGSPSGHPLPHPERALAATAPPVVVPAPTGAPSAAAPAAPVPPTARPEISRTTHDVDAARRDPDDAMAGSPTLAYGLIGGAVFLQLAAGLWGLWRWRRGDGDDRPDPVDHEPLAPATSAALAWPLGRQRAGQPALTGPAPDSSVTTRPAGPSSPRRMSAP